MLTHRTNLLLTQKQHQTLKSLSYQKRKSVGELIRHVIDKEYVGSKLNNRAKILEEIRNLTKNINTKGINYKELIASGRKW